MRFRRETSPNTALRSQHADEAGFRHERSEIELKIEQRPFLVIKIQIRNDSVFDSSAKREAAVRIDPIVQWVLERTL